MTAAPYINLLKLILLVATAGYLLLMGFAYLFANRLVFPAPSPGYRDSPDLLKYDYTTGGESVSMVYRHVPGSRYLIFYHHGNAEDLQGIQPRIEALVRMGFSVLAWDYPGYGTSDGRPSAELINKIAEGIWHTIPDTFPFAHEQVLLYGRSVGGGPATWLASRHRAAGLVLESTFTSIFRVVLPVNILPWDIFDNLALVGKVQCPVLFLHGTRDHTVPFRHGKQLHERAPEPKFFAWIDGGRHNDLVEAYSDIYYSSILRFTGFLESEARPGEDPS